MFKHEIIRIDDDVYALLLARRDAVHHTPNQVLRRVFGLPVPVARRRAIAPRPAPRVKGMVAVMVDGRRIRIF